jgi:hypothetical protein
MRRDSNYCGENSRWGSTTGYFLHISHDAELEAKNLLYEKFKIKLSLDKYNKVEFNSLPAVMSIDSMIILPFTAKINSHICFQAKKSEQYLATTFKDLLTDVYNNSVYPKEQLPKHSSICVHVVRALHEGGIFKS